MGGAALAVSALVYVALQVVVPPLFISSAEEENLIFLDGGTDLLSFSARAARPGRDLEIVSVRFGS